MHRYQQAKAEKCENLTGDSSNAKWQIHSKDLKMITWTNPLSYLTNDLPLTNQNATLWSIYEVLIKNVENSVNK